VIAGERADQAVREFTPEDGLETIASAGPRGGQSGDSSTVVEEAADGLVVRRYVHGPLVIGRVAENVDPWRE
jgi:hypothetical protein